MKFAYPYLLILFFVFAPKTLSANVLKMFRDWRPLTRGDMLLKRIHLEAVDLKEMVIRNPGLYLDRGKMRTVYLHPKDPSFVVKIWNAANPLLHRPGQKLDMDYIRNLGRRESIVEEVLRENRVPVARIVNDPDFVPYGIVVQERFEHGISLQMARAPLARDFSAAVSYTIETAINRAKPVAIDALQAAVEKGKLFPFDRGHDLLRQIDSNFIDNVLVDSISIPAHATDVPAYLRWAIVDW